MLASSIMLSRQPCWLVTSQACWQVSHACLSAMLTTSAWLTSRPRWPVLHAGLFSWQPGSAVRSTYLYRSHVFVFHSGKPEAIFLPNLKISLLLHSHFRDNQRETSQSRLSQRKKSQVESKRKKKKSKKEKKEK